MGVGKSAVAALLAQSLHKTLISVDLLIEKAAGKNIAAIFREDGEIAFRQMEIEAIEKITRQQDLVIDCGGGVPLNRINIDRLKQQAVIIWLTATPEVILERTGAKAGLRPLLEGKKRAEDIQKMLEFRKPFYCSAADFQIDTAVLSAECVAEQIINRLEKYEDFGR